MNGWMNELAGQIEISDKWVEGKRKEEREGEVRWD